MDKNKNIAKVEKQENRKSVVKVVLAVFMSEFYLHVYTFAVFYCGEIYITNISTLTILKRTGQWQLVFSQRCATIATALFQDISHHTRRKLHAHHLVSPHFPISRHPLSRFLFYGFAVFGYFI